MAPGTLATLRLASLIPLLVLQASAAVTLDKIANVPNGWTHTGTPSDSANLVLQVALSLQNLDQLEPTLATVSTPGSASYGQHLDLAAINELFGPSNESHEAVTSWLESSGVKTYKTQGSSIWIQTNVSTANALLGTTFKTYSDSTGVAKVRTTEYSIPDDLAEHIDLIAPTTYFGQSKAMRANRAQARNVARASSVKPLAKTLLARQLLAPRQVPSDCNGTLFYHNKTYAIFAPNCLKEQYNVQYTPDVNSGSKIAFGSFLNESASFSDLALFEQKFGIPSQNFSVVLVNPDEGATDLPQPPDTADDGEANLDVQIITGLAGPLPITEYITAGSPPYFPDPVEPAGTPNENEPYVPFYEFYLYQDDNDLPQVLSNSYGDEEQTVPESYAVRTCNLIGLLGLRGVSVLHSSGDEGVGASCLALDGVTPQFNPIFPATCPYVTSVGGTVSWDPEIAWSGSSGGFSNYFKQAWYQKDAVTSYLDNQVSDETKEYYGNYANFSGRGFPDVAGHSVTPDYSVFQGGVLTPSGGTSAASPMTASLIALLNDARLRAGKPTLGFLNPLIYLYASEGFTDITSGQANGCDGNDTQTGAPVVGAGVIPGAHWNATAGWDPVTGFGVPNFGKLLGMLG
ncbi:subtilisin-like protein [Microthyrium microscopicum]|uniref:tripeptidyl-peptidase II n=1 Tax=Microthyrium microscopicum TaxID=703497 RepID=A0A6A6UHS2_9PEZI|nr:subtilisin-like protein [Microthyrium microscopicum]